MAEVVLFHHALGLTDGVRAFATLLTDAGHTVHAPDLFEGATFDSVEDGVAHAQEIGFDTVMDRGVQSVDLLPSGLVYAGFSLGVMPAQRLTQTRQGARGALLFESFVPPEHFGAWPVGVPVQIHGMEDDPWFAEDRPFAEEFAATNDEAELFLYQGSDHLFTDSSLASYDLASSELVVTRVLAFLDGR